MVMATIQIRLTKELVSELQKLVENGMYSSVSEAARDSVRRLVTQKDLPKSIEKGVLASSKKVQDKLPESIQKPKGTTDFYPGAQSIKATISARLKEAAESFGYLQIEAPAFEDISILTAKQGPEILDQIFTIEKRSSESFGLRFDMTVSAARMFIQKQKELPKPVRWFYFTRMWRYERPQQGRLREFYQYGTELFGESTPKADAETIRLLIASLESLGLTSADIEIRINNRKLLEGILEQIIGKEKIGPVIRTIDKKEKITEEAFVKELLEIGLHDTDIGLIRSFLSKEKVDEIDDSRLNESARQGKEEIIRVLELLKDKSGYLRFDLKTARGLAYYTGTVFECFDKSGSYRSIAGGGRYDRMISQLGGVETPATGFGIGYSTLSLLLQEKGLLPIADISPDYFIAVMGEKAHEKAQQVAQKLRKDGKIAVVDITSKGIGKQFRYANAIGAKKSIAIGDDELQAGKVKIKDMKTGSEEEIGFDEIS